MGNARRWQILAVRRWEARSRWLIVLLAAILLTQGHLQGPIVRYVAAQSQRQIRVDGRFQVELLSLHPGIVAERVTIGNPPWMPPGGDSEIGHLELTYDLPSSDYATVVMEQATLHLTREENGHSNWQARPPGSVADWPSTDPKPAHAECTRYFDDARRTSQI